MSTGDPPDLAWPAETDDPMLSHQSCEPLVIDLDTAPLELALNPDPPIRTTRSPIDLPDPRRAAPRSPTREQRAGGCATPRTWSAPAQPQRTTGSPDTPLDGRGRTGSGSPDRLPRKARRGLPQNLPAHPGLADLFVWPSELLTLGLRQRARLPLALAPPTIGHDPVTQPLRAHPQQTSNPGHRPTRRANQPQRLTPALTRALQRTTPGQDPPPGQNPRTECPRHRV